MDCTVAGVFLPAPHCRIDIMRVDFYPVARATDSFSRNQCAPRPQERVQNDFASCRTVQESVSNKRHRLHGWVEGEKISLVRLFRQSVDAGIVPHVRTVAPESAELD